MRYEPPQRWLLIEETLIASYRRGSGEQTTFSDGVPFFDAAFRDYGADERERTTMRRGLPGTAYITQLTLFRGTGDPVAATFSVTDAGRPWPFTPATEPRPPRGPS